MIFKKGDIINISKNHIHYNNDNNKQLLYVVKDSYFVSHLNNDVVVYIDYDNIISYINGDDIMTFKDYSKNYEHNVTHMRKNKLMKLMKCG